MPPVMDDEIRGQGIKEWLSGNIRDEIAANKGIGAGTVSNIISDFKKGIEDSEFNSIRELTVWSKKEGITLSDIVSHVRLINMSRNWMVIWNK
jgi:hypothetical protein